MDKYTKTLLTALKIPLGIFFILTGLGFVGVSVWVSTFSDVASMLLLASLIGGGAVINYGIGYAFLGDEYRATSIVRGGNTVFAPVESSRFLQRRKIVTLIGSASYILLAVYYIIRAVLDIVYKSQLEKNGYNTSVAALFIFAFLSLFIAFCLFMLYKKTKHVDLNEE